MKKILSITLCLLMAVCVVAVGGNRITNFMSFISAEADEPVIGTGKCGENVTYSFDFETGTLTISGTGKMNNYYSSSLPWYSNRNLIKKVDIKSGVTSIGNFAFSDCTELTSVTISDSVTSLGVNAFYSCTGLTSITIPESVTSIGDYAFDGCTGLTEIFWNAKSCANFLSGSNIFYNAGTNGTGIKVVFGESVENIPSRLFYVSNGSQKPKIISVNIGKNVTSIGSYVFSNCTDLTSITIPDSVTSIGEYAFDNTGYYNNSDNWDNSVLYIGDYLIKASNSISGIYEIKNDTMCIANKSFYECTSLTSITIPDSVINIGYGAFSGCTSLTEIFWNAKNCANFLSGSNIFYNAGTNGTGIKLVFGESAEKIPSYLFYVSESTYKPKVVSVTIGKNVTSVGEGAFYSCTGITKLCYFGTIDDWCNISFENGFSNPLCYAENLLIDNKIVKNVDISNSVTEIKDYVFYGCKGLETITISNSVSKIGDYAFYECTGIKSVEIPNNVESIGDYAFYGCTELLSTTIGQNVKTIGNCSFYRCKSLKSITIPNSVTKIGNYAFYGCTGLSTLNVGENVSYIGCSAFNGCTNLEKINWNAKDCTIDHSSKPIRIFYGSGTSQNELKVTFGNSVENIPDDLFYCNSIITSVDFGNNVKCIGNYAFYECEKLDSVSIPNSVTKIGKYTFSGCTGLTTLYVGENVLNIGDYAFRGCTNLEEINWSAKICDDFSSSIFYNAGKKDVKVTFSDSVENIPDSIFSGVSEITSVSFGNNIVNIGKSAFYDCDGLSNIVLPESVRVIESDAFNGCDGLSNINIPDGTISIGNNAFAYCGAINEITLPESLKKIEYNAFGYCNIKNLNYNSINCSVSSNEYFNSVFLLSFIDEINIGNKVEIIPKYLFNDMISINNKDTVIKIGDSKLSFGDDAFSPCSAEASYYSSSFDSNEFLDDVSKAFATEITSITKADIHLEIAEGSYAQCSAMEIGLDYYLVGIDENTKYKTKNNILIQYCGTSESIVIPSSMNIIKANAFEGNSDIKSIEIPYNVSSIGNEAFLNCTSLETVIIPFTVTSISDSAFNGTNAKIYCYYNSYAYNYAKKNNISYELISATFDKDSVAVKVGETQKLSVSSSVALASGLSMNFKSDNTNVATIDGNGNIKAVNPGTTTIAAYTLGNNYLGSCEVTVSSELASVYAIKNMSKYNGKTLAYKSSITMYANTENCTNINWVVSGVNDYKVNSDGSLTINQATNNFSVYFTAKDVNGNNVKSETETINVKHGFFDKLVAFFKGLFGGLDNLYQN